MCFQWSIAECGGSRPGSKGGGPDVVHGWS
jgi:hypothetical protein